MSVLTGARCDLVVAAKLGMGPGPVAGIGGAILRPQQHQRHALATQFNVHLGVVGCDNAAERRTSAFQTTFQ